MISCQDCNFFLPNQWSRRDAIADGECRCHPPVVTPTRGGQRQLAKFPSVSTDDWCGEFVKWPAPLGQGREEEANRPVDATSHDDATRGPVAARAGQCEPLPDR